MSFKTGFKDLIWPHRIRFNRFFSSLVHSFQLGQLRKFHFNGRIQNYFAVLGKKQQQKHTNETQYISMSQFKVTLRYMSLGFKNKCSLLLYMPFQIIKKNF